MMDFGAVLDHAKSGTVTEAELRDLVAQLRSGVRDHPQRYRLVMAAGWASLRRPDGAPRGAALDPESVRPYIEPLLDAHDDPWLVREALTVLCDYFPGEERYRDILRAWVRMVPWDEDRDVRTVAISALGALIASSGSPVGVADLLRVAEDATDPDQDWALRALARAVGIEHRDLPRVSLGVRSRPDLVARILDEARRLR